MKTTSHNESRQMFLDTLVEFYGKLGNKGFWADMKQRDIALEALTQDYMRTDHTGFKEEDSIALQSAINEYQMREKYIVGRITNE